MYLGINKRGLNLSRLNVNPEIVRLENQRNFDRQLSWTPMYSVRDYPIDWKVQNQNNPQAIISLAKNGMVEGYLRKGLRTIGRVDKEFGLAFDKSRVDLVDKIVNKYVVDEKGNIYTISLNRLNFECLEIKYNLSNNNERDYEAYSVIDSENALKCAVKTPKSVLEKNFTVHRDSYNMLILDNKNSVKKIMDHVFRSDR
jgi:hypothetical protein